MIAYSIRTVARPTRCAAYCFRSGQIRFGRPSRIPKGAITLLCGPRNEVLYAIESTARLAYDNRTWLVPGIPEAADGEAAFQALERYADRVLHCHLTNKAVAA